MDPLLIEKMQQLQIKKLLETTYREISSIQLIVLASVDGFNLATSGSKAQDFNLPEKFAAMASSMAALSQAAGKELDANHQSVTILDFKGLQIVLRIVKTSTNTFILAIAESKEIILGNLLVKARDCAQNIKEALQ
ncbi:MAG: roadblock/LC7 domain-containing protein [Burkholderiales bacterium]|jgi:predicted regulator of Ras-like GTPase activity (Roadblock/LC7/MglB family)|nr:roadblock/LC7 domain-containing protein [Burkholderiales bacterium]